MSKINPRAARTLEKITSGESPFPPMWDTVAIKLVDAEVGRVCLSTCADDRHINAFGGVHGGFSAAVLDTALGLSVFVSLDDEHARHTTVDLSVKIVKGIPLHTDLVVEANLVHMSRSIGVSQGVIRDDAGTVYAHGTTTCLIKR